MTRGRVASALNWFAITALVLALTSTDRASSPALAHVLDVRTVGYVTLEPGWATIRVTHVDDLSIGQRVRVVDLSDPTTAFVEGVIKRLTGSKVGLERDYVRGSGSLDPGAAFVVAGEPGERGPEGAIGATGEPGPVGPVGPQGPAGPRGPAGLSGSSGSNGTDGVDGADGKDARSFEWAYYIDKDPQPIVAANVAQFMRLNYRVNGTTGISITDTVVNGVTHPATKLVFAKAGIYNLAFSAQLFHDGNQEVNANIWFRRNNITAPWSNTIFYLGKNEFKVASWNLFVEIENDGGFIHLMWSASTTDVLMRTFPAQNGVPETASLVLTINEVGDWPPTSED